MKREESKPADRKVCRNEHDRPTQLKEKANKELDSQQLWNMQLSNRSANSRAEVPVAKDSPHESNPPASTRSTRSTRSTGINGNSSLQTLLPGIFRTDSQPAAREPRSPTERAEPHSPVYQKPPQSVASVTQRAPPALSQAERDRTCRAPTAETRLYDLLRTRPVSTEVVVGPGHVTPQASARRQRALRSGSAERRALDRSAARPPSAARKS